MREMGEGEEEDEAREQKWGQGEEEEKGKLQKMMRWQWVPRHLIF